MGKRQSGKNNLSAADLEWLGEEGLDSFTCNIQTVSISYSSDEPINVFPANTANDETLLERQAKNKKFSQPIIGINKLLDMSVYDCCGNKKHKRLDDFFKHLGKEYQYNYTRVHRRRNKSNPDSKPRVTHEFRPTHQRKNKLDHVRNALDVYKKSPDYVDPRDEKPAVVLTPDSNTADGMWVTVMPKSKAEEYFKKHQIEQQQTSKDAGKKFKNYQKLMRMPVYHPDKTRVYDSMSQFYRQNSAMVSNMKEEERIRMCLDLLPALEKNGKDMALMVRPQNNETGFEVFVGNRKEIERQHKKGVIRAWHREQARAVAA